MKNRMLISELEPDAYQAMFGLEGYLEAAELSSSLKELVKIRASQINHCAYCIQLHTAQARKSGETETRIYALSAWRESPLFTDKERAVLAVTEEVTLIADGGLSEQSYQNALEHIGEHGLAQCIIQIATINAWNRIAVSTHMLHE